MSDDSGSADGMYNYALIVKNGEINVQDKRNEVVKYLKMAINKIHVKSMNLSAKLNKNGDFFFFLKTNSKKAFKYFKMAAENGDVNSMSNLGCMFQIAQGCQQNLREADRYFKMSADGGEKR